MKPDFALNLSLDGISLLARQGDGWSLLGEVALDDPQLLSRLHHLRDVAADLAGPGFATKIIVPNSQILYATLKADPDEDSVRAALDGRSFHPVSELVVDFMPLPQGRVRIAALTRETLHEAAAFAADHGFNPVAVVAMPDGDTFPGEPWFGALASAKAVIARLGEPERDVRAVALNAATHDRPQGATGVPLDLGLAGEPAVEPVPEPVPEPEAQPTWPEAEEAPAEDLASAPAIDLDAGVPVEHEPGEPDFDQAQAYDLISEDANGVPDQASTLAVEPDQDVAEVEVSAAPVIAEETPAEPPAPEAIAAEAETEAAPPVFARRVPDETEAAAPRLGGVARDWPEASEASALGISATADDRVEAESPPEPPPLPPEPPLRRPPVIEEVADEPPADLAVSLKAGKRREFVPPPRGSFTPSSTLAMPPALAKRLGITDPNIAARQTFAAQARQGEAALSPFGARKAIVPPRRRTGATAVLLVALLVAFMAAAAIWASFLPGTRQAAISADPASETLGDGARISEPIETAERPAGEVAPADQVVDETEPEAEALADGEGELLAEVPTAEGAVPDISAATEDGALLPEDEAAASTEPLPADVAASELDSSTVRTETPVNAGRPGAEVIDGLYIAAIDAEIRGQDAIALVTPSADRAPTPAMPLLPPGVTIELDERGLVKATPEGSMAPGGYMVFLGKGDLAPTPRPQAVVDAAVAAGIVPAPPDPIAEAVAGSVAADAPTETVLPTDPAAPLPEAAPPAAQEDDPLFEFKPRPRPTDLQETTERNVLGGLTRVELAGVMPQPRPKFTASGSVMGDLSTASDIAPRTSPFPKEKPANIGALAAAASAAVPSVNADEAVAAALGTIAYNPDPTGSAEAATEEASTSSSDQGGHDEGDEAAADVAPSIPTSASVARQATVKDAIDLSEVALIGVYGSASQRRALVRLPSGKVVKVKVGDKLDGGRVAAIGERELQYTKKSRTITLSMPKQT